MKGVEYVELNSPNTQGELDTDFDDGTLLLHIYSCRVGVLAERIDHVRM